MASQLLIRDTVAERTRPAPCTPLLPLSCVSLQLTADNAELLASVAALERERDFYFGKLRDAEVLLQGYTGGDRALVDSLFAILYVSCRAFVTGAAAPL